jgi:hypothetical protein
LAFEAWLADAGALGQNGVPAGELSIYQPRFNATVAAANTVSQPWIVADTASGNSGSTMQFTFNTPVSSTPTQACGRAVYSDLHAGGDPSTADTSPPPTGCDNTNLSAQERALEFTLFDLSSCVIADSLPVSPGFP